MEKRNYRRKKLRVQERNERRERIDKSAEEKKAKGKMRKKYEKGKEKEQDKCSKGNVWHRTQGKRK